MTKVNVKEVLTELAENGKDWATQKTSVEGLRVVRSPSGDLMFKVGLGGKSAIFIRDLEQIQRLEDALVKIKELKSIVDEINGNVEKPVEVTI